MLAGQAFTAAYPYDLGLATLLATLWALQRGRVRFAACCTLLTLGFSPLAFLFLALTLFALLLRRRRINGRVLTIGAAVVVAAGGQLAVLLLLPSPGLVYPYGTWRFAAGLGVAGLGILLALRGRGGWALANLFGVWALASVVFYLVPSPVGHNVIRASVFLFPLILIAAKLADFRPRWLVVVACAAALAANVLPYAPMISQRSTSIASTAAFWRPVLGFLRAHLTPGYRVEVVPTDNHWEAYYLPTAGIPLARGWYRQLDIADNPTLYADRLTPAEYRSWLRRRGVRFVVLPHVALEAIDAEREASLLRLPGTGLRLVWTGSAATIYELPHATPILTGPAPAAISSLQSNRISGWVGRAGTYLLRVHFTPYWSVTRGRLCLEPAGTDATKLRAAVAGPFTIKALESPAGVLDRLLDGNRSPCRN